MSQSLSDEEFHRMQVQLIEMRTDNYQLKDENKKISLKLRELTEKEARLDKELNKQIKMKKALSTLNKSKQSQEYEALLQQQEQEFALQNQTLMQELSKLSISVEKLEKENQQLKKDGRGDVDLSNDSELRRLQAQNIALKNSIENIQKMHKEAFQQHIDSYKQVTQAEEDFTNDSFASNGVDLQDPLGVWSTNEVEAEEDLANFSNNQAKAYNNSVHESPNARELKSSISYPSSPDTHTAVDQQLLHSEAQCERLKQQLLKYQDMEMQYETEKEEKKLLEATLEEERSRYMRELRALTNEVEAFRDKLDRKQAVYLQLQDEKEELFVECKSLETKLTLQQEEMQQSTKELKERLQSDIASLGNALQNSQNLVDEQQIRINNLQKQVKQQEETKIELKKETERLKALNIETEQKIQTQQNKNFDNLSQAKMMEADIASLKSRLEKIGMERDDAVSKFEENARASGALLQRVDSVELSNEALRRELTDAKELAEKRKRAMDKQAMDTQENNTKFTERITHIQSEYEATMKHSNEKYEDKIKALEQACKRQEQELIKMHHLDRSKTMKLDSSQQQVHDIQATISTLENSKRWYERELEDAEKLAKEKEDIHLKSLEVLKEEHQNELEKCRLQVTSKDEELLKVEQLMEDTKAEIRKKDEIIKRMEQDIRDEVSKQRLVEKKGQAALKDLKRQLANEKKQNEKLQEKLGELSLSKSNIDELMQLRDERETVTAGDSSSVSSFSFRDFILPNKALTSESNTQSGVSAMSTIVPVVSVSKAESRDLLGRITSLQQDKWQLEEQVRHLEESAGAMADELLEKSKLLQQYVQRTRTDVHKTRTSNEELGSSRTFGDRMKSIITGQEEADVMNIRELNRKLTRMLEEEMMKNMALKQDLANLSNQLVSK